MNSEIENEKNMDSSVPIYVNDTPIPNSSQPKLNPNDQEEKTDSDLLAKFNSFALDESDSDEHPCELRTAEKFPRPHLEPKRHTSELPRLLTEWNIGWSKLNNSPTRSPRSMQTELSTGPIKPHGKPPGLAPPNTQRPPYMHHPYSSNNLTQVIQTQGNIPMYNIPGYYLYQPTVVPVPMVYGYYNYPQMNYKMEPQTYLNSTQQPYAGPIPNGIPPTSEISEAILALIKEYEKSGDFTKLSGEVRKLARLQSGSRFLQKEIEKTNPGFFAFVLKEIDPFFPELMIDEFGNYFCQRVLMNCTPSQRNNLLKKVHYL